VKRRSLDASNPFVPTSEFWTVRREFLVGGIFPCTAPLAIVTTKADTKDVLK